jgi:hypothetical protein
MLMIREPGGSDFFEVYPRRWSVSVLVTSRDLQLDIGQGVAVGKLRLDDAVTLLAKRALIDLELEDISRLPWRASIIPSDML